MSGLTARLEGARLVDVALWAAVALGLLGGLAATVAPVPAVGIAGTLFVTIGLLAAGRRSGQVFLGVLAVVLGIYAFLSRGGAYVGVPPIYIGEVALFIGIVALLLNLGNVRPGIVHVLLLAFMAWGLVRTVPYVVPYGIDALRDGVVWAYGLFALAVAATIRPRDYRTLVGWYRRLVPAFLIAMPVFAVAVRLFDAYIPKWPSSPSQSVGIIYFSNGHAGVHLAAVAAFFLLGLYGVTRRHRAIEPFLWVLWLVGVAISGSLNRGSLLAASSSGLAVAFVRSRSRLLSLVILAPIILGITAIANPVVDLGTVRKVSFDQLVANVLSVFGNTGNSDLEGTAEWRLAWWQKIAGYTIDGPYFWDGKGFGINLADDDGFQVNADGSLRAPHNGHIGILARAGVPGLALWILVQAAYALGLIRAAIGAHRVGRDFWVRIHAWMFVYWIAAMINMSFDPYLESPHGGIWFWAAFGLGLGAMRAWKEDPGPDLSAPEAVDPAGSRGDRPLRGAAAAA